LPVGVKKDVAIATCVERLSDAGRIAVGNVLQGYAIIGGSLKSAAWRTPDAADGGGPVRAGVSDHRAALRDRAGGQRQQLDAPARQRLRQEQARPILEKLHAYLQEQQAAALPKSPLRADIGYALRNWVALTRYAEDGRLKIDSNGAEQALRPIVLGRKNWLFAGSEAAAHRTAILCSLVQTCKHLQINPFVYLRDVIERVSTAARLLMELTPREWKRLRPNSGAQAAA
jgi:hypothetical protein